MREVCEIRAEALSTVLALWRRWRFVAEVRRGELVEQVARSPAFRSSVGAVLPGRSEREALQAFTKELVEDGWEPWRDDGLASRRDWYRQRFYRTTKGW